MHVSRDLIRQLRQTIGIEVVHNGIKCTVVELLEEPFCLVLQALGVRTTIQNNQYGSPQRMATQVFTIPCLSDGNSNLLHRELVALGLPLK